MQVMSDVQCTGEVGCEALDNLWRWYKLVSRQGHDNEVFGAIYTMAVDTETGGRS